MNYKTNQVSNKKHLSNWPQVLKTFVQGVAVEMHIFQIANTQQEGGQVSSAQFYKAE